MRVLLWSLNWRKKWALTQLKTNRKNISCCSECFHGRIRCTVLSSNRAPWRSSTDSSSRRQWGLDRICRNRPVPARQTSSRSTIRPWRFTDRPSKRGWCTNPGQRRPLLTLGDHSRRTIYLSYMCFPWCGRSPHVNLRCKTTCFRV